ncbi:hypothetical protein QYM39_05970 [Pediococcus pentosaceus]|uniref:hypothetical protein n=1 Tax=Pediococcus pentosaceus TaxID=1255 RepID=UPI00265AF5BC|nr:hypothetical protein [Pediococcus pentosaceus]WKF70454.1 hypothetical protein QYM39_05970 [Pediococcus pentosaceus]
MSIELVTDDLDVSLGENNRKQIINNFKQIEKELNNPTDISKVKTDVSKLKNNFVEYQKQVDGVFEQLASFMNRYDIPLGFRDGKIIDLEEEN